MAYASNTLVVRAAKLVDGINLDQKDKKYDFAKVIFNSDNSNASDCSNLEESSMQLSAKTSTKVRPIKML